MVALGFSQNFFTRVIDRAALPIFFFQAEDGIRDWSVTGVQTCALPILREFRQYWRVPRNEVDSVIDWAMAHWEVVELAPDQIGRAHV